MKKHGGKTFDELIVDEKKKEDSSKNNNSITNKQIDSDDNHSLLSNSKKRTRIEFEKKSDNDLKNVATNIEESSSKTKNDLASLIRIEIKHIGGTRFLN